MTVAYVDASALTKLVLAEHDSAPMLRWYVESERVLCSRVGIVEMRRAARRREHDPVHLDTIAASVEVIELDTIVGRRAAMLLPTSLRSLDAIHLASALVIAAEVDAFVTYDVRLAEAAREAGLPVVVPSA